MRFLVLSLVICGGLFYSGIAQTADNVDQAVRYRISEDNMTTFAETNSFTSEVAEHQVDLRVLDHYSNTQLEQLGSRYGWVRSSAQLDELGSRYGWVRSSAQLDELGSRYGWVRSSVQLDELGSRYGWVRSSAQLDELGSRYGWVRSSVQLEELGSRYGWVR
jgi:hypothetical protein